MFSNQVEIYIYQLGQDSQCWCKDEFLQILTEDEEVIHSSVVVYGTEYSFGENGIEEHKPKLRPQYVSDFDFEEAVSRIRIIGKTNLTESEVKNLVRKLKNDPTWFSCKFNPVEHNCHHFSEFFVKLLCEDKATIPVEILNFNRKLVECREFWISEFYQEE